MALRQAPRVLRAQGLHSPEHFFLPLARVLKRPIVCSGGVKSKSNFGSPDNLSNFGAPGQPRQQLRNALMMQEAEATGTVLFSTKLSTCTTTVSWSSCSTRTRLSEAPSRPEWSVSPKARKTSMDLCVQRMVGLLQTQAQQGHALGGLHALVQQNSQAWGHHPRLAQEFVRSAVRATSTWLLVASHTVE